MLDLHARLMLTPGTCTGIKGQQKVGCWNSMLLYGLLPKCQTLYATSSVKLEEELADMLCSISCVKRTAY